MHGAQADKCKKLMDFKLTVFESILVLKCENKTNQTMARSLTPCCRVSRELDLHKM